VGLSGLISKTIRISGPKKPDFLGVSCFEEKDRPHLTKIFGVNLFLAVRCTMREPFRVTQRFSIASQRRP